MKIKDYLSNKILMSRMLTEKCFKNVEGFDFTELEDIEVFEAVKKEFESKDLWLSYGPVSLEMYNVRCRDMLMQNGKIYPIVEFFANASFDGIQKRVSITFSPFGCVDIDSDLVYAEKAKKRVSKAFAVFMAGKFGITYVQTRSSYFGEIKNLKIKAAQMEKERKVKEAEEEYRENLFDVL